MARQSLLIKLLVGMLVLTVIPLIIVGALALQDAKKIGQMSAERAGNIGQMSAAKAESMNAQAVQSAVLMGDTAVNDATTALNNLGADMIKQEAQLVAKQLEIYIKAHPDMTVAQLQNDSYFRTLAVQPVGKLGYTAITDYDTLTCRFHSNPKIENMDLSLLATKLPGFWGVMARTKGGIEAEGFYDWLEPDNVTIKQKYMYIALVNARTADNVGFHVAATTYIDEFNAPAIATRQKISDTIVASSAALDKENKLMIDAIRAETEGMTEEIRTETEGMTSQNTIFVITAVTILVVVLFGLIFAKSITDPVKRLKDACDNVINGDLSAKIPEIKSNDEIMDLTAAIETLVTGFKAFKNRDDKPAKGGK